MQKIINVDNQILNELSSHEYVSTRSLSSKLKVSEKTIREHVKFLSDFLNDYGAKITNKYSKGYRLQIDDQDLFSELFHNGKLVDSKIPVSAEERPDFIICYLLLNEWRYVDVFELAEKLNVSESRIVADMKTARTIAKQYDLDIETKRKEGFRIIGSELNIRICMSNYYDAKALDPDLVEILQERKEIISRIVIDELNRTKTSMYEISLDMLINYLYVSVNRIKRNQQAVVPKEELRIIEGADQKIIKLADTICDLLEKKFNIVFNEEERKCIYLFAIAQRTNKGFLSDKYNVVIPEECLMIVNQYLEFVYQTFNIDFRNNFSLITALCAHLVPLSIRLKYNMRVDNPLLHEIKKNCSFGYAIASQIASYYEKMGGNGSFNENEIGFVAVIFESAIKYSVEIQKRKSNILLVCESGMGGAQLLAIQYKSLFGDYLDKVLICNTYELEEIDFSKIDYVFTTVPIRQPVPVPIFESSYFMDDSEIESIKSQLKNSDEKSLKEVFVPELFISDVKAENKEEILEMMCEKAKEAYQIPDDFYESVMLREGIGSTDFADDIALAHPEKRMSGESFAVIAVLEKPLFWSKREVSIVMLLSITKNDEVDVQDIFSSVAEFIVDSDKKKELIRNPDYDTLIKLLKKK